jgi:toxin CptA
MRSEPAIRFDYRPSRLPWRLAVSGLGLVLLAVYLADLPWMLRLSIAATAASLVFFRRLYAKDRAVRQVRWASDGSWTIRHAAGQEVPAHLVAFRIFGSPIVLNLRIEGRAGPTLWLAGDNTDEATRRRLRMRLARIGCPDS